jgi:PAS domain S-box-containing protein
MEYPQMINLDAALAELAPVAYVLIDCKGRIRSANKTAASDLGTTVDEIIGEEFKQFIHPGDVGTFTENIHHQFGSENRNCWRLRITSRDKGIYHAELTTKIVSVADGMSICGIVIKDITEYRAIEELLKEKEHLLLASQEAANIGSYSTNLKTRKWISTPVIYDIFGIDTTFPRTLDAWIKLVHPDYRERVAKHHHAAETQGIQFDLEYKIISHKTKETRWVHGLGQVEYDRAGQAVCMFGTIQDITKRKIIEEEQLAREELYRTIFENTGTSMVLIDDDMSIIMANRQFIQTSGRTEDAVIGHKWTEFVSKEDLDRMIEQHRKRRQMPDSVLPSYEFKYLSSTGDILDAMLFIQLVPGTSKSVASLVDITARRDAERKLRASEEKFRTLAESCPFAIMMHQGDCWIYANKTAADISGYTIEELCGIPYWEFVHPEYQNLVNQTGKRRQQGMTLPASYEFKIVRKDGEERWVSVTGNPIRYEDKPTALVSLIDITERRHAEDEKDRLENQLRQAQKMESVGRLAGGVAHDFNNMLGVIVGHTELSLMGLDAAQPLYSHLREIRKAAERSADLTRQLLAFARKQTIAPKVLDLNGTISCMLNMLRRLIGENIHLIWKPSELLWAVKVDPSQIDQILANLCVNAHDAIRGNGKITIETDNVTLDKNYIMTHAGFVPGDYVKISVSDDGCGMSRDILPHIFEPFYTTKGLNEGTGLGLSMVYGAVKQNNGFVNAYSEVNQGTTISVYLPRYEGKAERTRNNEPADQSTVSGTETILIVEDEPAILEVTTLILDRLGYKVLFAGAPGEAIEIARNYKDEIHLLITDVVMPEMNGRDLAKNLLSLYPDMKRVFMSGYTANVIAHHGVLDEGVHFIQKPFSSKDLADKIREALRAT